MANYEKQPYTLPQVLTIALNGIIKSHSHPEEVKQWWRLPENSSKTWQAYKTHFSRAHIEAEETQDSYTHHMSHASQVLPSVTESTISSPSTQQLQHQIALLSSKLDSMSLPLSHTQPPLPSTTPKPSTQRRTEHLYKNDNYPWSHGFDVSDTHSSATCKHPKPGHQPKATRENTMNGNIYHCHFVFPNTPLPSSWLLINTTPQKQFPFILDYGSSHHFAPISFGLPASPRTMISIRLSNGSIDTSNSFTILHPPINITRYTYYLPKTLMAFSPLQSLSLWDVLQLSPLPLLS